MVEYTGGLTLSRDAQDVVDRIGFAFWAGHKFLKYGGTGLLAGLASQLGVNPGIAASAIGLEALAESTGSFMVAHAQHRHAKDHYKGDMSQYHLVQLEEGEYPDERLVRLSRERITRPLISGSISALLNTATYYAVNIAVDSLPR